jgi:hypothetical protein
MAQFGGGLMDRQRLTLADNAYHTFVTVPRRLPELVHRYVFARQSFYAPPPPATTTPSGTPSGTGAPAETPVPAPAPPS